jgi:hypothetical protein
MPDPASPGLQNFLAICAMPSASNTMMIYTHVLNREPKAVRSPLDD